MSANNHLMFSTLSDNPTATVNDDFVLHLFQLIEQLSDDADDPYHYPIIRVLVRMFEPTIKEPWWKLT